MTRAIRRVSWSAVWRAVLASEAYPLVPAVLVLLALAPVEPALWSAANLQNLLGSMIRLSCAALGQMLVLVTGGIDLTVGAVISLASVVGAMAMREASAAGVGSVGLAATGLVTMIAIGAFVGGANGLAVTRLGMPAFMVTLAVMMLCQGLAVVVTASANVAGLPGSFLALEQGTLGPFPMPLLLVGGLALVLHVGCTRTVLGRWLFATGRSLAVARISGVPTDRVTVVAYGVAGACSGLAAVLYTGRLEVGTPSMGQHVLLDVIGACVIGGTSLTGGRGSVVRTLAGAAFMAVLDNAFTMLGLSMFAVMIGKGGVVLAAALLDLLRVRGVTPSEVRRHG